MRGGIFLFVETKNAVSTQLLPIFNYKNYRLTNQGGRAVTEQEYYSTISDYNQLLRQKGFNIHACNDKKLDELGKALIKDIAIQIAMIDREIDKQSKSDNDDDDKIRKQNYIDLMEHRGTLIDLQQKISLKHFVSLQDYDGTFYDAGKIPLIVKMSAPRRYKFCDKSMRKTKISDDEIMYYALISDYNTILSQNRDDIKTTQKLNNLSRMILKTIDSCVDAIEHDDNMTRDEFETAMCTMTAIRECVLQRRPIADSDAVGSYRTPLPKASTNKIISRLSFGALFSWI